MTFLQYLLTALFGWALGEGSRWLRYKKETAIELRQRPWEKAEGFSIYPRAWDDLFSKGKHCWLRITLNESIIFGGYFGNNSFASSYPHDDDIYIEDVWNLSAGETYENHQTRGLLIERKKILYMEILKVEEDGELE
jgi:hypothetical protein